MIAACTTPIAPMQGDLLNCCQLDMMSCICFVLLLVFLLTLATKAFTNFVMRTVHSGLISKRLLSEGVSSVSQGTPWTFVSASSHALDFQGSPLVPTVRHDESFNVFLILCWFVGLFFWFVTEEVKLTYKWERDDNPAAIITVFYTLGTTWTHSVHM